MASSRKKRERFRPPSSSRQVNFHQLLIAARKTWLRDALRNALGRLDPETVQSQLNEFAPKTARRVLAAAGIRDEFVLPVPAVLEIEPSLVGYYRLLLGSPRKSFYRAETGLNLFQSMEKKGTLTPKQKEALPEFCLAMARELADLVVLLSPQISMRDLDELPVLTLGAMFQGANNVRIGEEAKQNVFAAVREIVKEQITSETSSTITVKNAARRLVHISFGADPDICIKEQFGEELRSKVAIEIKGGGDLSNAHNRAGEAEKSHQKARRQDFRDFWTLISMKGLDRRHLSNESPTTTSWFDVVQVLAREGPDWEQFRSRLQGEIGIEERKRRN